MEAEKKIEQLRNILVKPLLTNKSVLEKNVRQIWLGSFDGVQFVFSLTQSFTSHISHSYLFLCCKLDLNMAFKWWGNILILLNYFCRNSVKSLLCSTTGEVLFLWKCRCWSVTAGACNWALQYNFVENTAKKWPSLPLEVRCERVIVRGSSYWRKSPSSARSLWFWRAGMDLLHSFHWRKFNWY